MSDYDGYDATDHLRALEIAARVQALLPQITRQPWRHGDNCYVTGEPSHGWREYIASLGTHYDPAWYDGRELVCESIGRRADGELIANAPAWLEALAAAYQRLAERDGDDVIQCYITGQDDVVARLRGDVDPDDDPLAPICPQAARSYALWCLAHNIAMAAGATEARHRGAYYGTAW